MKIALITDSHAGARGDSPLFADYFDKFYYEIFFPYLKENSIKNIIHLGDIVDKRKGISYITGARLNKFVETCTDNDISLDVIIGNHDIPLKHSLQNNAMSVLFSHSKFNIRFFDKPQDVNYDGLSIAMLPWICRENYDESMDFIKSTKSQVLMGHIEIQGFEMYRGSVNDHGFKPSLFDKFDLVMSGHFHHKSSKGNIHYLGSPFEITWGDWNDARGFHIFDTDTRELTYIRNPLRMFHKIFYRDDIKDDLMREVDKYKGTYVKIIIEDCQDKRIFDEYFTLLEKVGLHDIQVIEDVNFDRDDKSVDVENIENTKDILVSYISQVNTKVDKDKLCNYMIKLHDEAMNIE